jgi:sorting nexin-13
VSAVLPIGCLLAGVVNDRGKTYGIYAVSVAKHYETGYSEKWHVYRRYSDFHDLHQKVKDKVSIIVKVKYNLEDSFIIVDPSVSSKCSIAGTEKQD